ncbi:MAG: hypothetical protein UR12_C0002G0025 [candidate division TM6 bacterium GW2011_GWF2_30_66]|nr:MAG: hypothetical protein UR12_C0002G0025 [candidate division TM6 bacterium GW2011_GWF2_30_66]
MNNNIKNKKASLLLLLTLFISFVSILFFLLYTPISKFTSDDPYPEISTLIPSKIIEFGGSPTTVHVGLYIRDIPTFDILNSRFILDAIVLFKFDHRQISLDRIGKFKFDRARIIEQSKPQTKIEGHNLIARYDMKLELNTSLSFKFFPLDDHRVNISITNYSLTPSEVVFSSSMEDLTLNPDLRIAGWEVIDKMVKTGFLTDKTYSDEKKSGDIHNPRVIFSLDFANIGIRHLMTLLIPLLIIFLISTITFTFDPTDTSANIVSTSIATITALIAYKFVIESMSPKTGYLMLSDNFFLYIFFGCITIFIFNLFSNIINGFYKNIITATLYIIYTILFIYSLYPLLS